MDEQPPATAFNLEAEQALLGAIFINNEAYHRVSGFLRADHFYEAIHGEIYAACAKIIGDGRAATPITVKAYLPEMLAEDSRGEGFNVTMAQYLARLCTSAATIINAPDYAHAIRDEATRRDLIEIADTVKDAAISRNVEVATTDIIEMAERALYAVSSDGEGKSSQRGFDEALTEAMEMAAAAYSRDGTLSGIATGLNDLDRMMGGLQRSDLIILAARPAMGKTSLATNIAFHVAGHYRGEVQPDGSTKAIKGGRVAFFSLEMSAEQLATRILSEQAEISSSDIRRGNIAERDFGRLADVANRIKHLPLTIEDAGGLTIGQLVTAARRLKRQRGVDLIIVDYIQLLSGTTKRSGENRVQEVTEITTKLKGLAKELGVPIIALSQLSRQVENREDKRPHLADLRESGSIEQDADVVMFIYREEYYLKAAEPKEGTGSHMEWQQKMEEAHGKADVIIAKQRHGPTGTVQLHFDDSLTRFGDLARPDYMPERRA